VFTPGVERVNDRVINPLRAKVIPTDKLHPWGNLMFLKNWPLASYAAGAVKMSFFRRMVSVNSNQFPL
jgi:hypothetical protein